MKNLTLLFVLVFATAVVSFGQASTNASAEANTKATVIVPRTVGKPIYGTVPYVRSKVTPKTKRVITGVEVPEQRVEVQIDQSLAIQVRQEVNNLTETVNGIGDSVDALIIQGNKNSADIQGINAVLKNHKDAIVDLQVVNQRQDVGIGQANATAEEALRIAKSKPGRIETIAWGIGGGFLGAVIKDAIWKPKAQVVNNNQNNNGNWNRGGWNRNGSNNNGNNNQGCGGNTGYNCPTGPNNTVCNPSQFNNWCGQGNGNNGNNNSGGPRRVYNCPVGTNCSYPVNTGSTPTYTGGGTNVNNNYNNPIGYTNGGSSNTGNVYNNPGNNAGSASSGSPTRIIY